MWLRDRMKKWLGITTDDYPKTNTWLTDTVRNRIICNLATYGTDFVTLTEEDFEKLRQGNMLFLDDGEYGTVLTMVIRKPTVVNSIPDEGDPCPACLLRYIREDGVCANCDFPRK